MDGCQHFVLCEPLYTIRYGDVAGNTDEENSSVFSLIRMR